MSGPPPSGGGELIERLPAGKAAFISRQVLRAHPSILYYITLRHESAGRIYIGSLPRDVQVGVAIFELLHPSSTQAHAAPCSERCTCLAPHVSTFVFFCAGQANCGCAQQVRQDLAHLDRPQSAWIRLCGALTGRLFSSRRCMLPQHQHNMRRTFRPRQPVQKPWVFEPPQPRFSHLTSAGSRSLATAVLSSRHSTQSAVLQLLPRSASCSSAS